MEASGQLHAPTALSLREGFRAGVNALGRDTSLANTDNRNSVHRKSAVSLVTVPSYLSPLHSLTDSTEFDDCPNHTIRPPNRVIQLVVSQALAEQWVGVCGIRWWSNVQDRRILSRFTVVLGCSLAPRAPIGDNYSVERYSRRDKIHRVAG